MPPSGQRTTATCARCAPPVGALPKFPSNALNYNLTWSADGVINEYIQTCEAIVNGEFIEVPALEEREEFSLDSVTYEAFNTSGSPGTLSRARSIRSTTGRYAIPVMRRSGRRSCTILASGTGAMC